MYSAKTEAGKGLERAAEGTRRCRRWRARQCLLKVFAPVRCRRLKPARINKSGLGRWPEGQLYPNCTPQLYLNRTPKVEGGGFCARQEKGRPEGRPFKW